MSVAARTILTVLFVCLAALPVLAAGLSGTVRDASGGAVAAVEVVVMTPQRTVVATTRTAADGRFQIASLPEGRYLLVARAAGFRETTIAADVTATEGAPLAITLDIDQVQQEVSVTATPGTVVDRQFAVQPVNIITQEKIAQRATTVLAQAVNEEVGVNLQRTSPTMAGVFVRGLTGNKVNVFLDGVRYSTGAQRGGVNTFFDLVEPSSLETIEILRGPNSAEYGSDALGGSIQLLGRVPGLSDTGVRYNGAAGVSAATNHESGGFNVSGSMSRQSLGLFGNVAAQGVGELRPGGGIDSHAAVTRFFGLPSDTFYPERLPDTGFHQWGTMFKANWTPRPDTQLVATYVGSRQDGGDRYDQLLGGDGNLVSELNDMTLDLFYVRAERVNVGWFDHASVTYSINSQREERVNQGGNGNPRATIGHEPERTTANGFQGSATKQISPRQSLQVGGELYLEHLTSDAFDVNPVTSAVSPRRPRVPSDATFRNYGFYAQTGYDAVPNLVKVVGALRWGGVHYRASATDAPIVNGRPLWPDDSLSSSSLTFRAGAVITPREDWTIATSLTRGYRPPHMTDLGTLGLTGSGFEVAAPDVEGLNGTVGNSAAATAVSTGDPVEQLNGRVEPRLGRVVALSQDRPQRRSGVLRQQHLRQHPEAGADPAARRGRPAARHRADHVPERQRRGVRGAVHGAGAGSRQLRQRQDLGRRAARRSDDHEGAHRRRQLHLHAFARHDDRPAAEHRGWNAGAERVAERPLHGTGQPVVGAAVHADCRRPAEPVVARSRRPAHRLGSQPHEHSQLLHQRRDGPRLGRGRARRRARDGGRCADGDW